MLIRIVSVAGLFLACAAGPVLAQATTAPAKTNKMNPEAVELLRRLLEQQRAQPDKILRAPASQTNAPAKTVESRPVKEVKAAPAAPKAKAGPAPVAPVVAAPPQLTPEQKKVSEVEARIDEMMRQKEAREKAASGSRTNAVPTGPLTKRQKLDALLKDYIDGRIPEADYHARRARLVAEPD